MDVSSIARQASPAPSVSDSSSTAASSAAAASGASSSDSASSSSSSSSSATGASAKAFVSPIVQIDGQTGAAVLSFRDPNTGAQDFQLPSRTALQYERQQRLNQDLPHSKEDGGVKV